MQAIQKSLIKTLCYSDIFDYPLTLDEVFKYYLGTNKVSPLSIKEQLKTPLIIHKNGYYCLKGRENIIREREKKENISNDKLKKAGKICGLLSYIPGIKLIGITGSLAMRNSSYNDDIDLFIITRKNTLWIVRFFVNVILILIGEKRDRFGITVRDKICPNMYISEDNLCFKGKNKNIFIAHEIVQMKILINKENTYEKFINSNIWILDFMKNCITLEKDNYNIKQQTKLTLLDEFLEKINRILFNMQFLYMKNHITYEQVSSSIAKFHPKDKKSTYLKLYKSRVNNYVVGIGRSDKKGHKMGSKIYTLGH